VYRVVRLFSAVLLALSAWSITVVPASAIEAYVFRGAGDFTFIKKGLSFSEGMDKLGDEIAATGAYSQVYRWEAAEFAYRDIIRRHPDSVALIGHSMGALSAIAIANRLKNTGIRVAYLGVIDIPGPVGPTPGNVEVAENYYHAYPVFGQLTKGPNHRGSVTNNFVWGQIHITMDNSKKIHSAMLTAIASTRGQEEVMQAYADGSDSDASVVGQVDRMLTASTTSDPQISGPRPQVSLGQQAAGEPEFAGSQFALVLPQIVPVPTPRPYTYATLTGLPPIE
jgi:pimeloyl-ACP methyl ester carboxylesterase